MSTSEATDCSMPSLNAIKTTYQNIRSWKLSINHMICVFTGVSTWILMMKGDKSQSRSWYLSVVSVVLVIVCLSSVSAACPDGCRCFTNPVTQQYSQVVCDQGTQIPAGLGNVSILNLNGNRFHNPVLSRSNFSELKNLEELLLSGCGIETIQPNTFLGELNGHVHILTRVNTEPARTDKFMPSLFSQLIFF